MSINSTNLNSSGNPLVEFADRLFQAVDADRDGKLTSREFQSFLEGLLGSLGRNGLDGGSEGSTTTASSRPVNGYQGMLGFNYQKLNDLTHTTPKYVFARATQNVTGIGFDRASRSAALQRICDDVKANGYPNAVVTADDTIDFGDGFGNIDVLTSGGEWWWGPEA